MSTQELLNHPNFLPALKRQAPYDLEDSNDFVTVEADTEPVFGSFHQAADEKNSMIDNMAAKLNNLEDRLSRLEPLDAEMNSLQKNRLVTMKGNCAVDFLKKVQKVTSSKPPGSSDESHSTSRLGKTGSDMYQKRRNMLARLPGLDDECFKVLRDIDMYINGRNVQSHETANEFAVMLLSERFKDRDDLRVWKTILTFTNDRSLEELANGA